MIGVIGAGAFGTAMAVSLSRSGAVQLWSRDRSHVTEMFKTRLNSRRLPDVRLPESVLISDEVQTCATAEIVLLCIPTQKLRGFLEDNKSDLKNPVLVACCKGVELKTGKRPTQIISDVMPDAVSAMLTGPSFASDIANDLPTALTLATADDALGARLQTQLTTSNLRVYRTTDVAGAEFGGALKNVVAIACGAAMGAGLGESARAALMTRGFAEMTRFACVKGARAETLAGLSGFGDLSLTCTSQQSRNYRYGFSLGDGQTFDHAVTVEGAATARAVAEDAQTIGLDLPITQAVAGLVSGQLKVGQAIDMLLSRPLKEE